MTSLTFLTKEDVKSFQKDLCFFCEGRFGTRHRVETGTGHRSLDHYDDYDKRTNDLDSLQNIASRYESLEQFLADMALDPPEKSVIDAKRSFDHENNLTLSTIHSAKGLEWNTVFLLFVAEGYLPSYRSFDSEEAIEEERRLFYVATTRAKENLFLLRPQMDLSAMNAYSSQGSIFTKASRFLGERDILKKLVTVESNYSHSLLT